MSATRVAVKELRRARGEISVRLFGAQGQDGPDETSSIQAAINAATAGDTVLLDRGTYRHTGLTGKAGVTLAGQNKEGCILKYTPTTGDMITLGADPDWFTLKNLKLDALTTTSGWAVNSPTGVNRNVHIEDVEISGALKGIFLDNGLNCYVGKCRLNGQGSGVANGIGIQFGESGSGGNSMTDSHNYVTGYETGRVFWSQSYVSLRPSLESAVTGFKNHGTGVIIAPWTTSGAGSNTTDFDVQTPVCIVGYGSSSFTVSYASTTIEDRSIIIPERLDVSTVPAKVGHVKIYSKDQEGGSVVLQNAALATNATAGFTYIPTCAGTPTGTPTARTGTVPMVYDSTNNRLYIYDGAWISAAFA